MPLITQIFFIRRVGTAHQLFVHNLQNIRFIYRQNFHTNVSVFTTMKCLDYIAKRYILL